MVEWVDPSTITTYNTLPPTILSGRFLEFLEKAAFCFV